MKQDPVSFFSSNAAPRLAACLLFAAGAALLLLNLGDGSLYPWDESLSAMRAWYMYSDGISLTVRTYGEPDFNKPPLYYWMAAGMYHLLGPGLSALRLPGALFAFGCCWIVYCLGKRTTNSSWAACFALACLALNPHWLNFARLGKLEAVVAFSIASAVLWGCFASRRHSPAGGIVLALLLGIGAWVKHPFFGLLIPVFYLYWRVCDKAERPAVPFFWASATFLLVGMGWYAVSLCLWGKEFWNFYFEYNVARRMVHGIEGHSESFFFLIKAAFAYGPFTFLCFLASLPALAATWKSNGRRAALLVALAWMFLLLVSCMVGKRKIYIVAWYPLASASAAFGAYWLWGVLEKWLDRRPGAPFSATVHRAAHTPKWLFRICAAMFLYAAVLTGVTYRITPDHSPRESSVYRALQQQISEDAVVISNVDAPAVLLFELGRTHDRVTVTGTVDAAFMASVLRQAASGAEVGLVIEEDKKAPDAYGALLQRAAAEFPEAAVIPVASNGLFWAVRLEPAPAVPAR